MSPSIIDTKYLELGEPDFLGKSTRAESKSHDGKGKFRQYENGAIYLAPDADRAYEVHGEIFKKWGELDFESGVLGYPITDQRRMSDGVGRYSEFVNGIIYWSPETGAHSVRGSILSKYRVFGGPQGILGYPNANTIVVNAKPSVSISCPASGATFIGPATINITAAASDVNGTVSKVEFYQGAVKLGEDTIAPYSFSWTNVAVGNYVLTAKATDNHGGVTTLELSQRDCQRQLSAHGIDYESTEQCHVSSAGVYHDLRQRRGQRWHD